MIRFSLFFKVSLHEEVAQTTIAHLGLRSGFSLKEIENLRSVMEATTKCFSDQNMGNSTY